MKRQFSFLWVVFATLAAFPCCSPGTYIQSDTAPESALMRIDCYNAPVQQIVELLRSGRGKDINVAADGSYITAAFRPADTPPRRLEQIIQDLSNLSGVLHVEIMENRRPIMQNF